MITGFDIGSHRIAMSVLATGQSEYIDWSNLYSGKPKLRTYELYRMRQWVRSMTTQENHPVIERSFLSGGAARNPSTSIALTEVSTIIQSARQWDEPPILVSPTTWKKEVIDNYRADKDEIRDWLMARYPDMAYRSLTEDQVDAFCIAEYGEMLSTGEIEPPKKPARRKRRKKTSGQEAG